MPELETGHTEECTPVHLQDCGDILPRGRLCHTVRFLQMMLLGCHDQQNSKAHGDKYAIAQPQYLDLPADKEIDEEEIRKVVERERQVLLESLPITRDLESGKLPHPTDEKRVPEMRRVLSDRAPGQCAKEMPDKEVQSQYSRFVSTAQRQEARRVLSPLRRSGLIPEAAVDPEGLSRVIQETMFPTLYQPLTSLYPHIALCSIFEQTWCHEGYTRGERIASIGLAPGEELTLEVHSWTKENFKSERELAIEAEMTLSNKLTARDHLEVASQIATKSSFGANANADVTIPVKGVPIGVGGGVDAEAALTTALDTTAQRTVEATNEAVNTLKSQRKLRIEEARETGQDEKQLRKVANTNRCHTLNVHYFEVMSNFTVTLDLVDVVPCVLLPVPYDVITPAWVLCHEHILRSVLLDRIFLPGFEAAQTLETQEALERLEEEAAVSPPGGSTETPTNRHEEEMRRHRAAILESFGCLLQAETDAAGALAALRNCGINFFCVGTALGNLASQMPKLLYVGLLRVNSSAFDALERLQSDHDDNAPALESIRTFLSAVTPRDYQYNLVAASISEALDAIGIPGAIVDLIIDGGLLAYVDDDCGLYVAVKAAQERLSALESALAAADFDTQAGAAFEAGAASPVFSEPEAPISRLELAQAEVAFARLKCHLQENRSHYFQAIWSRTDPAERRHSLFPQLDCLIDRTPIGFVGDKAAYPILQPERFERWLRDATLIDKIKEEFAAEAREPLKVSLPTPGPIAEATVGQCCACEDYIVDSRRIDIRQKAALADQEEAEVQRRQGLLAAGTLDPFEPCCDDKDDDSQE